MTTPDKPKQCPAAVRKDLFCVLGRVLQLTENGGTLFWGMCPKCAKATAGCK